MKESGLVAWSILETSCLFFPANTLKLGDILCGRWLPDPLSFFVTGIEVDRKFSGFELLFMLREFVFVIEMNGAICF